MTRVLFISMMIGVSLMGSSAMAAPSPSAIAEHVSVSTYKAESRYVQRQISPREARAIALSRVPGGEVVDIRKSGDTYRVRIIARDGRVVDIIVDANTGRIR